MNLPAGSGKYENVVEMLREDSWLGKIANARISLTSYAKTIQFTFLGHLHNE